MYSPLVWLFFIYLLIFSVLHEMCHIQLPFNYNYTVIHYHRYTIYPFIHTITFVLLDCWCFVQVIKQIE